MAKLNPLAITRPPIEAKLHVWEDPTRPGLKLDLNLRKLSRMDVVNAETLTTIKTQQYVTGSGIPGKSGYQAPELLPPIDGQPVRVSESTVRVACYIERAQVCEKEDRYTPEELMGLMVSDAFCDGLLAAVAEIVPSDDPKEPTLPEPSPDIASEPEPAATPTS
jgi:hypothetical protein